MTGRLRDTRALVTGGASGIGLAIVREFLGEGATVAVLDREPEPVAGIPGECVYLRADLGSSIDIEAAVADAAARMGGLDLLVNNAGIGAAGTVETATDDEWQRVLDINVIGTARVSRAAWPHLRRSEIGSIVNISSIVATAGPPDRAVYSASKGAVLALTLAMAADGIADGIRVNAVNPGTADTPWIARLLESAADPLAERAALEARQPSGRLVSPGEVAAAVLYLAAPSSAATTGTWIAVDGGMAGLRLRPGAGRPRNQDAVSNSLPPTTSVKGVAPDADAGAEEFGRLPSSSGRRPAPPLVRLSSP